jgi:hypothetical protein
MAEPSIAVAMPCSLTNSPACRAGAAAAAGSVGVINAAVTKRPANLAVMAITRAE